MFNRRSKFNAKKAYCAQCHKHDSKREAARCDELHTLWAAGEIGDLVIQPQFWFIINGNQVKHDNVAAYISLTLPTRKMVGIASKMCRAWSRLTSRYARRYSKPCFRQSNFGKQSSFMNG
jgi:hypothetical protein